MCTNTSRSCLFLILKAWLVEKIFVMTPSIGATKVSPIGIMANPSPAIFAEKTSSSTSSIGINIPSTGAFISLGFRFKNPNIHYPLLYFSSPATKVDIILKSSSNITISAS